MMETNLVFLVVTILVLHPAIAVGITPDTTPTNSSDVVTTISTYQTSSTTDATSQNEGTLEDTTNTTTGTTISTTSAIINSSNTVETSVPTAQITRSGSSMDDIVSGSGRPTESFMNDIIGIGWEMDVYRVPEYNGSLQVCAALFFGNIVGNVTVVAYYTPGNATEGEDYSLTNGTTFIFTSNVSTICLNVTILNDFALEGNEAFDLILYATDNNNMLMPAITTIIILDDEEKLLPPSLFGPIVQGQPFYGNTISASCVSQLPAMYLLDNTTNLLLQVNFELSYIADNGEIREETLEPEPVLVNRLIFQTNSTVSLPPIAGQINVTCKSNLMPAQVNSRFIPSDQVISNLRINPTNPPISLTVTPNQVRVLDIIPYNNYTLMCNASLPADLSLLNITLQWVNGTNELPLTPSSSISISNLPPYRVGNEFIFSSVLSGIELYVGQTRRVCRAQVNLLELVDGAVLSSRPVTAMFSEVPVTIAGLTQPLQAEFVNVLALSSTWALVQFTVSSITYTPEKYRIRYNIIREEQQLFLPIFSETLEGSLNISSQNSYVIPLPNLEPDTLYNYTVSSTNNNFEMVVYSSPRDFRTVQSDIYFLMDEDIAVPTGALVTVSLEAQFSRLSFDVIYWSSLTNTMVPASTFSSTFNYSTNIADVTLFTADLSRSGSYILCVRNEMFLCGEPVNITVTVPTLNVSTEFLVLQYRGNTLVSGVDPLVLCTPSDSRAPIRWRGLNSSFPFLPFDLQATLTEMGQILIFPQRYETSPPDYTIILICDLQGANVRGNEISPQRILIRFLQSPVSILYQDREIQVPHSVINYLPAIPNSKQNILSLVCVSTNLHNYLRWEFDNSLYMNESIKLSSSNTINVTYSDISAQQRLVTLSIDPFTLSNMGTYTCLSGQTNYSTSVFITTRDPIFELISLGMEYYPIGAEVHTLTVRYGDRSVGYLQQGQGFNYSFNFLPCVEGLPNNLLIAYTVTLRNQSNIDFIFHARSTDSGEYLWNATHIDSGARYLLSKNITITTPIFVEQDSIVYAQLRVNITLRCVPNDTRSPVIWSIPSHEASDLRLLPQSYVFSPSGLDYFVTFNTSILFGSNPNPRIRIQPNARIGCGFVNGNERQSLYTLWTTLYIQGGRIEIQDLVRGSLVRNNSVINQFSFGSRDRRESSEDNVYESAPEEGQIIGQLVLECRGVQGDHEVSWYTDNSIVGLADGSVNCDRDRFNRQDIISNYSSRLILQNLNSQIDGNYSCRSSLSNIFYTMEIITTNPYIRRLSPEIISVDSGDTIVLGFRFIVNSYGDQLSDGVIPVSFNSSSGISLRTFRSNTSQPYNYYLIIPSATESDSGVYTATASNEFCNFEIQDRCEAVAENIIVIVTSYCERQVSNGFVWPRTQQSNTATLSCELAGNSFRTETMATRSCLIGGVWSEPDLSTCTLKQDTGSFLLVWFVLDMGDIPNEEESKVLEENLRQDLELFNLPVNAVNLQSAITASVSLSFEVILSSPLSDQNEALTAFMNYLNNMFQNFTGVDVQQDNRGLIGVSRTNSCPCLGINSNSSNSSFIELCGGAPSSPCSCNNSVCQCMAPFVGDGNFCTLDTDDDTFPDVPLQSPSCNDPAMSNANFCSQDNCRDVSNQDQNPVACELPEAIRSNNPEFDGCLLEADSTWQVLWPNTAKGTISTQQCPGGLDSLGKATRECNPLGIWLEPNILSCESLRFALIREQANQAFSSSDPQVIVTQVAIITDELIRATAAPTTRTSTSSLLPLDIQTTVNLLSDIVLIIENYNVSSGASQNVINIFNNILDVNHTIGWNALGQTKSFNGSELLLLNAERYSMTLAKSQLLDGISLRLSRPNIAIAAGSYNSSIEVNEMNIAFPVGEDISNFTIGFVPVVSNIPTEVLNTVDKQYNTSIPISHILFMNLENYLQSSAFNSETTNVASVVYSIQVGDKSSVNQLQMLDNYPLSLEFTFDQYERAVAYNCVFWEFSEPTGSGGFITDGVRTLSNSTQSNRTTVNCLSNHLTSFAVLVDVAGVIPSPGERLGLQIVSYVGCVISIICLTLSVIFFISLRKKLIDSINYFVHLNLSITLLMAFVVFTLGIELGANNKGSCLFVALLLHYLFLSAFCWMLSEGIVLYFLLVDIFNKKGNKWWIYILIGYVAPIPVVVISVASRYQYYGVKDSDGQLIYCWLSVERGTIFAFVAPMIAIIIVNIIFLILGLHSLYKNRRRGGTYNKNKNITVERVKSLLLASVVLVPLLGLTWAFGILTINANTTVFAWLFTILNSFQGLAIFFFHVIRNEKIWSKIVGPCRKSKKHVGTGAKWYSQTRSTAKGTYYKSRDSHSGYRLSSVSGDTMKKSDLSSSSIGDEKKIDLGTVESMPSADNTPSKENEVRDSEPAKNTQVTEENNVVIVNVDLQSPDDSNHGSSHKEISGDETLITNKDADTDSVTSTNDSEDYHISKL